MSVIVKRKCQLCGKRDGSVDVWVGGWFSLAHRKCAEISHKAVELYLLSLHHEMFGIELFVKDVLKVIEKEEAKLNQQKKLLEK